VSIKNEGLKKRAMTIRARVFFPPDADVSLNYLFFVFWRQSFFQAPVTQALKLSTTARMKANNIDHRYEMKYLFYTAVRGGNRTKSTEPQAMRPQERKYLGSNDRLLIAKLDGVRSLVYHGSEDQVVGRGKRARYGLFS
jgi:hypothetical protein